MIPGPVLHTNTQYFQVSIGSTSQLEVTDLSTSTDRSAQLKRDHRAGVHLHPLPEGALGGTIRHKWQENCTRIYCLGSFDDLERSHYTVFIFFFYDSHFGDHRDGSAGKGILTNLMFGVP